MNAELIPFPRDGEHFIARFNHVKALGTAWREARTEYREWWAAHGSSKRSPYGSEEWIREEVDSTKLARIVNAAEAEYRAACDEFFFATPRTGEGEA